jgi:methionyl-tRNA synthetase
VGEFVTACNSYIEMAAPWKLAKDSTRAEALDHALFVLAEALRVIAILISPVLPKASREILYQLNLKNEYTLAGATWGALPEKHQLGKPTPLFPRIEI